MTPLHPPITHAGATQRVHKRDRARGRLSRAVRDAACFAGAILTGPLSLYPVRLRGDEATRKLPGDELLPAAKGHWTHAITVRARPADIWPWLAQMGCRRAGWYSYDGLDNAGVRSAERIIPEFQEVRAGDLFPWTPTAEDGFFVHAVDPGRVLVLGGDAGTRFRVMWAFVLEPLDDTSTRLLTRGSAEYRRFGVGLALRLFVRPIHFAMQRRQLLNLRRRAESRAARSTAATSAT